jgi:predicted transcriptional regulator
MVQRAEMPDGARFICMARGLTKPSGSYLVPDRRYAVALGCEEGFASQFVYGDRLSPSQMTPIGTSCRICPRAACTQRAYPPSDRRTIVDVHNRGVVPYRFE